MGLDITAYRQLVPAPGAELEDGYPVDYEHFWRARGLDVVEKHWPRRSEGLVNDTTYSFADSFGFRAGSYGGYNRWRETLTQLASLPTPNQIWEAAEKGMIFVGPFAELINFSDCEGTIGPIVATKLAKDFAEREAAISAKAPDDYFREKYRAWRKAFEMAADNGAVDFH